MNHDEFAFFSRQLGSMLRDGIPLESGLRELCHGISGRATRAEIQELEQDLSRGTPLPDALARRNLPELFKRMVVMGARSNNLPGVLTMLADHYSRVNVVWTRLKGLMVYPVIVLLASFGLSLLLIALFSRFLREFPVATFLSEGMAPVPADTLFRLAMWFPAVVLGILTAGMVMVISIPPLRAGLRWKLPPFREASISQTASAMTMMLRSGTSLPDALTLAVGLEQGTAAGREMARWRSQVAAGQGRPAQWNTGRGPFPPLFYWLIQQGGEDLAAGFEKAAEIYNGRAAYRIEMMLYGFLPVTVRLLGQVILWQVVPMVREMGKIMNLINSVGD